MTIREARPGVTAPCSTTDTDGPGHLTTRCLSGSGAAVHPGLLESLPATQLLALKSTVQGTVMRMD